MKILQVHGWWEGAVTGGVVTVMRTLIRLLGRENTVDVLVNDWNAVTARSVVEDGTTIHALRMRQPYQSGAPLRGLLAFLIGLPRTIWQLRALVMREAVDVIHCHYAAPYQLYFGLLRRLVGTPYVITLHRGDVMGFEQRAWLQKWAIRVALKNADRVVAVSRWLADQAERTFGKGLAVGVAYNGLDFSELMAPDDRSPGHPVLDALPERFFVVVGNLHPYKGQDLAIRAWAELRDGHPDLHLAIVGEGDLRPEYEKLVRDLGVDDTVHLLGYLPRPVTVEVMRRSRGLIFPSRNEGFGLVLLEAGANAIPTICTRIAPFTELAKDGKETLMVAAEDPSAIAHAVDELEADPDLARRLGRNLRERALSEFSAEAMAQRYLAIYREVVARTTRREGARRR
jgi:glycosyltransferase involved in cell wall biosynthesis